jgi:DNA-binding CsgD family transcriptional regulator
MITGIDALSEKEKDALRLILRGHDAKSSARELGLSVHTVNERLREARRKLGVTSSREAARRLLAKEGETPERLGDKGLGDASGAPPAADITASATRRRAGRRLAFILAGVTAMSLIFAALLLPASPFLVLAPSALTETVAGAEPQTAAPSEAEAAARAAEAFLVMIDESRWADSYAATGAEFRRLNTLKAWTGVSVRVRPPLGKLVTRNIVSNEFVPAPPMGYQLVKFASTYADDTNQIESVSLAWEDGAWRVVGIVIG